MLQTLETVSTLPVLASHSLRSHPGVVAYLWFLIHVAPLALSIKQRKFNWFIVNYKIDGNAE